MDENCLCLLLWGTVTKEDLQTHSGRNNKQIERVNKWTSASASTLLPWHCAGRRRHNIIFSTLTISFRDFQRLSTGFLLSSRFINAWEQFLQINQQTAGGKGQEQRKTCRCSRRGKKRQRCGRKRETVPSGTGSDWYTVYTFSLQLLCS